MYITPNQRVWLQEQSTDSLFASLYHVAPKALANKLKGMDPTLDWDGFRYFCFEHELLRRGFTPEEIRLKIAGSLKP